MAQSQNKQMIYDYYETPVYVNQYEKNLQRDGYIKLPFTSYKSETHPNLVVNGQKYKTANLYVLVNSHNTAFNGELILEHVPITNGNDKFYVCVPLKTQPGSSEQTVVDKIIAGSFRTHLDVNLNPLLVTNKRGKVLSNGSKVVYFSDPILISTPFYAFANTDNMLFPSLSEYVDYDTVDIRKYSDSVKMTGMEGFKEGADGTDDMIIDCTPVDSSKDTVELVPLTTILGSANSDAATNQLLNTSVNFFSFLMVICVAAFVSPAVYRSFFVGFVDKVVPKNVDKPGNLKTFDVVIFSFFLAYCIYMVTKGLQDRNQLLSSVGVIFFIYLFLTTGIIIMLKESNPGVYQLNRLAGIQDATTSYQLDLFAIFLDALKREPKFVLGALFGMLTLMAIIIYSGYFSKTYGNGTGWSLETSQSLMTITWPLVLFGVFYVVTYYKT
jgi:hypothetical protein